MSKEADTRLARRPESDAGNDKGDRRVRLPGRLTSDGSRRTGNKESEKIQNDR